MRNTIVAFLRYIDENRASWIVMYTQATSSQAFAHTVREGREQIIELVAGLVRAGTRSPRSDAEIEIMAVALVGAGEAVASRLSTGDIDVDAAAEMMIDLFWAGLRGRRPTGMSAPTPRPVNRTTNGRWGSRSRCPGRAPVDRCSATIRRRS